MRETKELKVKYFAEDLEELRCVPGSDWVDLRAAEDIALKAGEFRLIPLGIAVALPEGYEAHVVPRSSTFKNYGLLQANSMGDQWRWPAYATRDVEIPKNTRLCQFRIVENQPPLAFTRVERLESPDRGGFGSTGK